jgi:hypothetical protein
MLNEYLKWRRIVWICCHNGHGEATPDERAPSLVVVSFSAVTLAHGCQRTTLLFASRIAASTSQTRY